MTMAATIRRYALGWLVAANLIGVWLAALLLWPQLND
jgi:cytochrome c oxidase cbb3-type subunit 1